MTIAAVASLFFAQSALPAFGQTAALQALLAETELTESGLKKQPAGSVRPTVTMEEQIKPCYAGGGTGVHALINVLGLQDKEGNVRVQVYSDDPEEFLENGKKLLRVDVPVDRLKMQVCVTFPEAGTYAVVVMHDRNANGRADILTEGFGFSRNPKLLFSKPDHDEVAFAVVEGVAEMDVSMKYMFRLSKKKRRKHQRH